MYHSFHKNFSFILETNFSSNSAYWMISEESCDTVDWSNDAENSALHNRNKLHFKIYSNRKQ